MQFLVERPGGAAAAAAQVAAAAAAAAAAGHLQRCLVGLADAGGQRGPRVRLQPPQQLHQELHGAGRRRGGWGEGG